MKGLYLFLLSFIVLSSANDNGVGLTPPMGYNTWYDFKCQITDKDIRNVTDSIIKLGLDKLGYVYVNMDDCWAKGRNSDGTVYPDPVGFPNGIKAVADYVHSKGLKFGIYTDRGTLTCANRPGSLGYEKIDALTYASWGVDFLKEDSCYASDDHQTAFIQYATMRDALNATKRPIFFSLCGWNDWYAPQGWSLGNSWRIAGDGNTWPDVLNAIDTNVPLSQYARPGGWNDPDILLGSTPGSANTLTSDQSRTMFNMWCIMTAPLLIGSNIRSLSTWDLNTYSNIEMIAVNQDPSGRQGIRVAGGDLRKGPSVSTYNIWAKLLSDGSWVTCFLNNDNKPSTLTCDAACFTKMGFKSTDMLKVRDLWTHTDLDTIKATSYTTVSLAASGGSVVLKFTKTV